MMNHPSVICLNIIVLLLSTSCDDLYYFYIYSYHPHPSSSNYLIGFRNVFNLLSSSKKPIVGHNCFFDLLFMIRWLDTTLPPTFEAFRCRLHTLFPSVYDTKFLAASGVVGESLEYSSLEQCYDYYNKINSINTTTSLGSDNSSSNDQDGGKDGDNIDDVVEKKVVTIVNSLQDGVTAQFHNAGK